MTENRACLLGNGRCGRSNGWEAKGDEDSYAPSIRNPERRRSLRDVLARRGGKKDEKTEETKKESYAEGVGRKDNSDSCCLFIDLNKKGARYIELGKQNSRSKIRSICIIA